MVAFWVKHIVLNPEVVLQLYFKIAASQNVIFACYYAIHKDMNRESIWSELCVNLLIYLDKNIMRTLHDTLFWFFFTHWVCESQLIKWNLMDQVIYSAIINLFSIWRNEISELLCMCILRISIVLNFIYYKTDLQPSHQLIRR